MATGVIVGGAIVGTYMEMKGNSEAASAKIASANAEAAIKEQQAAYLVERFEMNRKVAFRKGKKFVEGQIAAFVKGGVGAGGSTLFQMEETNRFIQEQVDIEKFETEKQAQALLMGAALDRAKIPGIERAKKFKQLGALFGGAGSIAGGLK